jgi:hypothetical protein
MTPHLTIGDDDPVKLNDACRLFFHGILTKSALRTEARNGNLEIIRIAGKDFVTRNGVRRMIDKCRKNESHQGSTCEPTQTSGQDEPAKHGLSEMDQPMSAQDALNIRLAKLRESSGNTSRRSSNRSATVLPLSPR